MIVDSLSCILTQTSSTVKPMSSRPSKPFSFACTLSTLSRCVSLTVFYTALLRCPLSQQMFRLRVTEYQQSEHEYSMEKISMEADDLWAYSCGDGW